MFFFIDLDVFYKYFLKLYYSDKKIINFKLIYNQIICYIMIDIYLLI